MFWGYLVLMATLTCFAALFVLDRLREADALRQGRHTTYGPRPVHDSALATAEPRYGTARALRRARLAH
jgi:hypothetical protein